MKNTFRRICLILPTKFTIDLTLPFRSWFTLGVVLCLVTVWLAYRFYPLGGKINSSETELIQYKVSQHIITPTEVPAVAKITDAKILEAQQPFYKGVQNGDLLLVYVNSRKAIIYNPRQDKILNAGPIEGTKGVDMETLLTSPTPPAKQPH